MSNEETINQNNEALLLAVDEFLSSITSLSLNSYEHKIYLCKILDNLNVLSYCEDGIACLTNTRFYFTCSLKKIDNPHKIYSKERYLSFLVGRDFEEMRDKRTDEYHIYTYRFLKKKYKDEVKAFYDKKLKVTMKEIEATFIKILVDEFSRDYKSKFEWRGKDYADENIKTSIDNLLNYKQTYN